MSKSLSPLVLQMSKLRLREEACPGLRGFLQSQARNLSAALNPLYRPGDLNLTCATNILWSFFPPCEYVRALISLGFGEDYWKQTEMCQQESDTSISQVDNRCVLNLDQVCFSFSAAAKGIIYSWITCGTSLLCEMQLGFPGEIWRIHRCSEHLSVVESADDGPFIAVLTADQRCVRACTPCVVTGSAHCLRQRRKELSFNVWVSTVLVSSPQPGEVSKADILLTLIIQCEEMMKLEIQKFY